MYGIESELGASKGELGSGSGSGLATSIESEEIHVQVLWLNGLCFCCFFLDLFFLFVCVFLIRCGLEHRENTKESNKLVVVVVVA